MRSTLDIRICGLAAALYAGLDLGGTATFGREFLHGTIPVSVELKEGFDGTIEWIETSSSASGLVLSSDAPSAWINIDHLPVVRNQLLSNCGAYAPSYYYKTYQEARERGWIRPDPSVNPERVMSPGFTFPLTNKGENDGSGLSTVLNVICRYGISTWADMPESTIWWEYPDDDIWLKALPYRGDRVIGFSTADEAGLLTVKQHLASGDLAVFAAPVSSNFRSYPHGDGVDNGVLFANSTIDDFHALTLIGYDDDRTYNDGSGVKTGAFLAVNSWGTGWGVHVPEADSGGFIWLSYDYMMNHRPTESSVLAMIDRIDYQPKAFAVLEISHDSRGDLRMQIHAGNGWGKTNSLSVFPSGGGSMPYHGTLTLDITDFMDDNPETFHLWAVDWGGQWHSPAVATLRRFEVYTDDGMALTNRALPLTMRNSDPEQPPAAWHELRLSVGKLQSEEKRFWQEPLQTPVFSWIDFNNNGHLDFVVFGAHAASNHVHLYINDGQGQFTRRDSALPPLNSVHLAWGDYNNDGYPDLIVSGRTGLPDLTPTTMLLRNDVGLTLADSGISLPQIQMGLAWGDYDQDGDLDLATSTGQLFRNDGGTNFIDTGISLLGGQSLPYTSVTWADLNHDGLMDLIINGQINMNIGGAFGGPFEIDPLNPPRVGSPGQLLDIHLWHDFNGDGMLDAAATDGRIYYDMGIATDYADAGKMNLWYEPSKVVFPDWAAARLDAADFNNSGLLDLAISGFVGDSTDVRFSAFRQETNRYALPSVWDTWAVETFTDIGLDQDGFIHGGVGWGDWDGDGDLDLLAGGYDAAFAPQMAVLVNQRADNGHPNAPPATPQRFVTTMTNENVLLQWHPAGDDVTPETSMGYEIRVGRSPRSADVVSPYGLGPMPGNARLIGDIDFPAEPIIWPRFKNNIGLPGIRLRNLSAGRYYWSVRAVDGGRARSSWSAEQSFTITAGGTLRTGDINADGKVDVADLVRLRKMIAGAIAPDTDTADLNADGNVSEADAVILANLLLEIETDGFLPVAEAEIGPMGGTLSDYAFTLTVPPGAFDTSAQLALFVAADERIFGADSPSLLWRITGIPVGMTGRLTISGPDTRSHPSNEVYLALGQRVRPFGAKAGDMEPKRVFVAVPGALNEGRLQADIPVELLRGSMIEPQEPQSGFTEFSIASSTNGPAGSFEIEAGWFSNTYSFRTAHFQIFWPDLAPGYVVAMGAELEAAFALFKNMGFPFEAKRDWSEYPVQLWLKKMPTKNGVSMDGSAVHMTDNGAYIELNIDRMAFDLLRRTTVYHEFFHIVQGLVNPAYSITEARDMNLLLLSEATATWMERFGSPDPTRYDPPNFNENKFSIFDGLSYAARIRPTEAGYAFSSMIDYMANHVSTNIVRDIYNRIIAGDSAINAIFNSVPTPSDRSWYHAYYQAMVGRQVYSGAPVLNFMTVLPPEWPALHHTYTATTNQRPSVTYNTYLPGLGAGGRRFVFTPEVVAALSDTSVLAVSLDNPRDDMGLGVVSARIQADVPGAVTVEDYGTKPTMLRRRVLNLKAALPTPSTDRIPWRSFVAVVTRADPPNSNQFKHNTLKMAVADRLDGDYIIPQFTHGLLWWNNEIVIVPEFNITSHLNLADVTGLFHPSIVQPMPGVNSGGAAVLAFQDDQISARLYFNATRITTSVEVFDPGSDTSSTLFTWKNTSGYTISKRLYGGPELEDQPYVFEPRPFSSGSTITLDENEEHAYFAVSIHYTIEAQSMCGGAPSSTAVTLDLHTTPLLIHLQRQ